MTTSTLHSGHAALHHDPQAAANAVAVYEEARLRELANAQHWRNRAWVGARIILGALFLAGAIGKAMTFGATSAAMSEFGLQMPGILLTAAIGVEGIGGLMLLLGLRAREAALALVVWLLTVTVVVHGNVTIDANRVQAFNNLAIIAALLFLVAHGAGGWSFDRLRARREANQA
jgi:putative oxidoreductase